MEETTKQTPREKAFNELTEAIFRCDASNKDKKKILDALIEYINTATN
jgi:hypothetical protein